MRSTCLAVSLVFAATAAAQVEDEHGALGSDALAGARAYQPTITRQGDRWILYVGHHGGSP
jgi:hypothetical protein